MASNDRRQRDYARLHTKILNAARALFIEHGYDAVTMRAIAKEIEYSPTTIYLHFKDKEHLIQELCAADFLTLAKVFQRIARIADPIERLRQVCVAYVDFGRRYPNHYRLMFMTPCPPMESDPAGVRRGNPDEDAYAFLKNTIADGVRAKRYRAGFKDVDLIAQTLWAAGHGVVALEITKAKDHWLDWRPLKKRVALMIDVMLQGLTKT
ncbi:MAG: TetR/AcrR family transcriptional regulator [Gammaproteobacteria bacterium]|nr:TetR/AcrR family transcriptional regulator [Gammaproteobacteria bacterium]